MTAKTWSLPADRVASAPPEARGLRRDRVRLLVAEGHKLSHRTFDELCDVLVPGDLLVVNTSPTMPAALEPIGRANVVLHMSMRHDDGSWTVELRHADQRGPKLDGAPGDVFLIPDGAVQLVRPVTGQPLDAPRLWTASVAGDVQEIMARHGAPIRYGYVPEAWPLEAYQTVFADRTRWPGSAEMPSAARPFTVDVVNCLRRRGIGFASIELHTGVSSQEAGEPPQPEPFTVPWSTAVKVRKTRRRGGRVIAVGTTVTRALESAVDHTGAIVAMRGWTDLVLQSHTPTQWVDGIITGWHPPGTSHLSLLRAVAGTELVGDAYEAALQGPYLWHEFGDSCLLISPRASSASRAA